LRLQERALPLGIHLEGPFLNPEACGAQPQGALRAPSLKELHSLWEASQGTLTCLTVAPERFSSSAALQAFCQWTQARGIRLSIGHSTASEEQATRAFEWGFSGVTHAWNALSFHHRNPGVLGAALGRPGVHLELICDQVHVAPAILRWTKTLHGNHGPLCYVSDCVATSGPGAKLQDQPIHWDQGAARFKKGPLQGALAGGGRPLLHPFQNWVQAEQKRQNLLTPAQTLRLLRSELPHVTTAPLEALGWDLNAPVSRRLLRALRLNWTAFPGGKIQGIPIDSKARRR
jgi:N-acetylglucosamine-6-phosphate deacetylase